MFRPALETSSMRRLTRRADQPAFPSIVAVAALAATLSMRVPFASLLAGAVLMQSSAGPCATNYRISR